MKSLSKEIKIGITGIAAIAILVLGINFLKGINMFKPGTGYYVNFENVAGLVPNSPVLADGFNVGIVRDIHYDYNQPGHVIVEMELNRAMKLPKGTFAEIETEMLGTVKMNLILPRDNKETLSIGDTILGKVNNGMMGEAAQLVPQIKTMMPKLDSILGSLNNLLADQALHNTLHNAEEITTNLQITTKELNTLLSNDIPAITSNLNIITTNFATISNNLKDIDYAASIAKVNETLDGVKQFTERLQSKENNIGLLLNDNTLYNNLTQTTGNAASLLEDLQKHPGRYVHFSIFGRNNK